MSYEGMCEKCRNRKSCKTPCAFVDAILKDDNKAPFYERDTVGANGRLMRTIAGKEKEVSEVYLRQTNEKGGLEDAIDFFSTDAGSPWADLKPTLNHTTIFIKRFFLQEDYEAIAKEIGTSVDSVRSLYIHAKERMAEALKIADSKAESFAKWEQYKKRFEATTGKLPQNVRWLLMNKVFDLSPTIIADIEGVLPKRVTASIRQAYDAIITGRYVFFEPSAEKIEAAQARLEKKRQRDRQYEIKRRKAA